MRRRLEPDAELLELARQVLEEAGYIVQNSDDQDLSYLIAEDIDNVVTLAATMEGSDLIAIEPTLSRYLIERLNVAPVGTKKWDGYVVLLTSATPNDETSQLLFELAYNLVTVRRIVRVRVKPTTADVTRSLRPVLPVITAISSAVLIDPMVALAERLEENLGKTAVSEALAVFRAFDPGEDVEPKERDLGDDDIEGDDE
jgi:hypothetical protein